MKPDKIASCDTLLIEQCAAYSKDAYAMEVDGVFIEDKETDTQSFVVVDGDYIVFTGQGTTSVTDWMIDFRLYRTRVPYLRNCLVHAGFMKSYNSIRERVYECVEKIMKERKIKGFICTGHSLFGAIATVASLDFKFKFPDLEIVCVTFGAPRAGSRLFASFFNENIDKSYRCVRLKDPVAFSPTAPRFSHVSGGLHFNKKSMDWKVPVMNIVGCSVGHHDMTEYLDFIHRVNIGEIPRQVVKNDDNAVKEQPVKVEEKKTKKRFWFW